MKGSGTETEARHHGAVVTWEAFAKAAPDLAARVRRLFEAHRHHTMATLRLDGSPRLSGTEVAFGEGGLEVGMMLGARRADDLRRDPRVALHSHCVDPPGNDPSGWPGEAKVSGRATEVAPPSGDHHRFVLALSEVVLTGIGEGADHLVIWTWCPGQPTRRIERR